MKEPVNADQRFAVELVRTTLAQLEDKLEEILVAYGITAPIENSELIQELKWAVKATKETVAPQTGLNV